MKCLFFVSDFVNLPQKCDICRLLLHDAFFDLYSEKDGNSYIKTKKSI